MMAVMYAAFLRLQTVEHRKFFEYSAETDLEAHDEAHSPNALHIAVMIGAIVLVGLLSEVTVGIAGCGALWQLSAAARSLPCWWR